MTVNVEKARIMLFTALGLTGASIVCVATIVWGLRDFVDKERAIAAKRFDEFAERQDDRLDAFSSNVSDIKQDMAAMRGAVDVQAEITRSLRSEFGARFDALTREQDRMRDDIRALGKAAGDGKK